MSSPIELWNESCEERREHARHPAARDSVVYWGRAEAVLRDASLGGLGISGAPSLRRDKSLQIQVACGSERFGPFGVTTSWVCGDHAGLRVMEEHAATMRRLVQCICAPARTRLQRLVANLRARADRIAAYVDAIAVHDEAHVASLLRDASDELSLATKSQPMRAPWGALEELRQIASGLHHPQLAQEVRSVYAIYEELARLHGIVRPPRRPR